MILKFQSKIFTVRKIRNKLTGGAKNHESLGIPEINLLLCSDKLINKVIMEATVFNPIQLHLLKMFSYDSTEEHLNEIKDVLAKHFAKKVDDEMDALWNEGKINADVIEDWGKEHMRTPYK